ncbi:MAG: 2OG-Fe(II) oxygenase [Dokdonella sp.]|nr:2OG-Fe(II) oxygenase [Rhodocyclaceae bacterium]MCB1570862.1 2OG-Fe(II) oxygenase [Xanthomonadales bacterium]
MNLLDPHALERPETIVVSEPFAFLVARDQLPETARQSLEADFPRYPSAGFFPHERADCGAAINALIDELTGPAIADAIGRRLGIANLGQYPTLVTICRALNRRHGTIHTDSRSKIATALLYLNESWPDTSEGCLRFLRRADSIDDQVTPEVKPLYGNLVAFRRSDCSFHGHLPYEGERRVIQVAWLTSEREKLRKTRRGRFSRLFKKLFGAIDRRIGAGRKDDASHLD